MRYIGSKAAVLPEVYRRIAEVVPKGVMCDPFGGIGAVGSYFKGKGYGVVSGDILLFPHYYQIARIQSERLPSFRGVRMKIGLSSREEVPEYLGSLKGTDGWFVREYAIKRRFFTRENAKKIQSIITELEVWTKECVVSQREKAVLLASLVSSVDEVANTAGTYYAYLKDFHRKALRDFRFQLVRPQAGQEKCIACHCDALTLVQNHAYDILYLDPPYNERSYGHYYHLPETLARQVFPLLHGKSGIPINYEPPRSAFNRGAAAYAALTELLQHAECKLIAFHYADDGLIDRKKLRRTLAKCGELSESILEAPGYTTTKNKRSSLHRLYLVQL